MPDRTWTERGFAVYDEFTDTYGSKIRVQESSSARGPRVWIFASHAQPHLRPDQVAVLAQSGSLTLTSWPRNWSRRRISTSSRPEGSGTRWTRSSGSAEVTAVPDIPVQAITAAAIAIERELLSGMEYAMAADSDEA